MASDERGSTTRARAERALAALAVAAGEHVHELVVVGGLTPPVLTRNAGVGHLGTVDIDLLVEVGLVYDDDAVDLGWLERALVASGFEPIGDGSRWQTRSLPRVHVDLVCDRRGSTTSVPIALPGCERASGMNLPGPRAARCDAEDRVFAVPEDLGGGTVSVPVAGLGGFLLSKSSAARMRQKAKDYYDFYFVVLHNDAGGPRAAAAALTSGPCTSLLAEFSPDLRHVLRAATAAERVAATAYARESAKAGDDTDPDVLVEDATTAAYVLAAAAGIDLGRTGG